MGDARWVGEDRRRRVDRRDPTRAHRPLGRERRQGPRRLRRSIWRELPTLLLALVAGLLTAIVVGRSTAPPAAASSLAPEVAVIVRDAAQGQEREQGRSAELRAAQELRDGAQALTRAEVELDEVAVDLWLPRLIAIDDVLADPGTSAAVRGELEVARRALLDLGLGGVDVDVDEDLSGR